MRLRVLVVLFVGLCVLLEQKANAAMGGARYNSREAARILRRIAPYSTLAQVKNVMPRNTIYGWDGLTQMGDWTWHVRHFRGARGNVKWEGVIVFANDRAKWARLRPARNEREREQNVKNLTAWRANDPAHSVLWFLGDKVQNSSVAHIERSTRRQISDLSAVLGRPNEKKYGAYGVGTGEQAWNATWKLVRGRTLSFANTIALLDGDYHPALELTFEYSKMYQV